MTVLVPNYQRMSSINTILRRGGVVSADAHDFCNEQETPFHAPFTLTPKPQTPNIQTQGGCRRRGCRPLLQSRTTSTGRREKTETVCQHLTVLVAKYQLMSSVKTILRRGRVVSANACHFCNDEETPFHAPFTLIPKPQPPNPKHPNPGGGSSTRVQTTSSITNNLHWTTRKD